MCFLFGMVTSFFDILSQYQKITSCWIVFKLTSKMYNLRVILLVNLIIANYVPNTETKATLYYEPITEQKAVDSLVEIQANQALPLVQLLNHAADMELQPPESLERVVTDKGRIINGTRFTSKNFTEQLLFCPKENSRELCLVPKEFEGLEPLQCAKEPQLLIREHRESKFCGANDSGQTLDVLYEICPTGEPKDYKNKRITLYTYCYNLKKQKTIFTSHAIVFSQLLDSRALRHEHNIKHNMEMMFGRSPSNLNELLIAAEAEESSNSLNTESQHQSDDQEPKKHVYKIQKLTPPEDTAFALWRKSTYLYFNAESQHKTLIPLWDKINDYIRNHAKKLYVTNGSELEINTGVFDLPSTPREDGQKSNVWVKLIYAMPGNEFETRLEALVIMMDNFINTTTEQTASSELTKKPITACADEFCEDTLKKDSEKVGEQAASSESTEKSIIDYCADDFCEDTLKKDFEKVGGRVRCCYLNAEIRDVFHWQEAQSDESDDDLSSIHMGEYKVPLLHIPGISIIVKDPMEEDQSEENFD